MLEAIRTWLTILVCWPAPAGPWCTMVLPIVSKRGRKASTTSFSPPIMIESRASFAPTSPPETGASTAWTFLALAAWSISIARAGSLVVMSTRTVPGFAPASVPSVPSVTSRTSRGKPTIVKTTSDAWATARGESASLAPFSTSGLALSAVRLKTVALYPAAIRWPHIDRPITPVPIQPIRVFAGVNSSPMACSQRLPLSRVVPGRYNHAGRVAHYNEATRAAQSTARVLRKPMLVSNTDAPVRLASFTTRAHSCRIP